MLIKPKNLKCVVIAVLQQGGSKLSEAETVAEHLVGVNLSGHDSHGGG